MVILFIERAAEDIEFVDRYVQNDGDILEVSPICDEVFESILVEVEAFDSMISSIGIEKVVVGENATDRRAVGSMNGVSEVNFRIEFPFRGGRAAGLEVIFS